MVSRLVGFALWVVWAWCTVARVHAAPRRLPVTVVVVAEPALRDAVAARLSAQREVPVFVRMVELKAASTAAADFSDPVVARALGEARARYVEADFEGCLARLPDDAALLDQFARGDVTSAARTLMYRAACQAGRGAQQPAQQAALSLARFGLEIPPDVGAVTPDVERMLTDALRDVRAGPRATLRVLSEPSHLNVAVDGRTLGCFTPCAVELVAGDHVVLVKGDGITPSHERVQLRAGGGRVTITSSVASPEVAQFQWRAHYGAGVGIDSAASLRLLAQAVRAPRLVLITTEPAGPSLLHLRGAYGQDGAVASRSGVERVATGDVPDQSVRLLEDLLVRGRTLELAPPIWKSVWFWTSVGAVAVGAATATALLLHEPTQRTQVRFPR